MLPAELTTAAAQPDSPERRAQIDDFMRLLEDARSRTDAGDKFALALLAPRGGGAGSRAGGEADGSDHLDAAGDDDAEAAKSAHDFLRLNLRRADALAFYGPTLLVALLPRRRPPHAREELARLLDEFAEERPRVRLAFGLASFPADGADVETLIEHADAQLDAALARDEGRGGADATADGAQTPAAHERRPAQEFLPLAQSGARPDPAPPDQWSTSAPSRHAAAEQSHGRRGLPSDFAARRAVRESRRGHDFEAAVLSYSPAVGASESVLGRAAAEAAARERERRAAGVPMPRRVLLTVSEPALMAQINLLLRSAAYEVRAAFDGGQALDLLRIERFDLLVLDYDLKVLDGPAVLRRLHERHGGRLPMPVALLLPAERDTETVREEARGFGATGFAPLPYDPAALLECVRTTGEKQ